jgi:hypothetical protein
MLYSRPSPPLSFSRFISSGDLRHLDRIAEQDRGLILGRAGVNLGASFAVAQSGL